MILPTTENRQLPTLKSLTGTSHRLVVENGSVLFSYGQAVAFFDFRAGKSGCYFINADLYHYSKTTTQHVNHYACQGVATEHLEKSTFAKKLYELFG